LSGRVLPSAVPSGARPTSARVREALFSMVGQDLDGQRILDAYGGSGLLALEAWSRGASVVVVEPDRRAARSIQENADGLGAALEVHRGRVERVIGSLGRFDGVLADPPYERPVEPVLGGLCQAVDGWLVLESDRQAEVPARAGPLALCRTRHYGGTSLHLYRRDP